MNTPKTRTLKRLHDPHKLPVGTRHPGAGTYHSGLTNPRMSAFLGELTTLWPHVEEAMIVLMQILIGDVSGSSSRKIFRSIVAQKTRIDVLKALLEETARNKTRDSRYDDAIEEFASLNGLRNKYLHGLWWTKQENGKAYFAEASTEDFSFASSRIIQDGELNNVIKRMGKLLRQIYDLRHEETSSQSELPQPPGAGKS